MDFCSRLINLLLVVWMLLAAMAEGGQPTKPYHVLFLISDDLTATALSCYGNPVCRTPNIDRLAQRGTRFTRAYCQGTYCGPSRASLMSGYYPHATGMLGYQSPRPAIGSRAMWAEHFKNNGYHTARVSKIFHMGVPGGIEKGTNGADDPRCWVERYNSQGPEWKAPGSGETLEGNPQDPRPVGGNTFVYVKAEGDDLVHSDGKTAAQACRLLKRFSQMDKPFWLGVGFVRPHVPFVAPSADFASYPFDQMVLPEKIEGDWDDIPPAGINYKTSKNMKMDLVKQKKALGSYYSSVAFMDRQVGKVIQTLEASGLRDKTMIIFTSDHGYHLGEHDFWAKVSLHEESARVPLIICVPGQQPAVCDSLVELLDLFPTTAALCGLEVPPRLQGHDLSPLLDDPKKTVREAAFCVNGQGFLLREDRWAYIQYRRDASRGIELFDMHRDPGQYTNLAAQQEYRPILEAFRTKLTSKLQAVGTNDLTRK